MKTQTIIGCLAILAVCAFALTATASGPPANDNFANAATLSGASGTAGGYNNKLATKEVGEADCVYGDVTNTVWFNWTCPANCSWTISTLGSRDPGGNEWDACIAIYTGATVSTAVKLAEQDTGYEETLTVQGINAGEILYLQAAGYASVNATNILLTWSVALDPVTNGWDVVPMASAMGNLDSSRSWLVPDPVNNKLFASRWDNSEFTSYVLPYTQATNPATLGSAWTSIVAPAGMDQNTPDNGTAGMVAGGYLYAGGGFGATSDGRKYCRLNTSSLTWQIGNKIGGEVGGGWAGVWAIIPQTTATGTWIYGQWCGTRYYQSYYVSNEATFTYYAVGRSQDTPSYWGVDAIADPAGNIYYYGQGVTTASNALRRATGAATVTASICTPWMLANGGSNDNQNVRTGPAIEYVPASKSPLGLNELWVMPARILQGGVPVQYSKIDRYRADNGAYLASVDLPFNMANDGAGTDMAFLNGRIFVMQGGSVKKLWSMTLVPEPSLALGLGLLGLAVLRKTRAA